MAVKSSRSVFQVLRHLSRADHPLSAVELSKSLDMPLSTTGRALATLEAADYAQRDPYSSGYILGQSALTLALAFMAQFPVRDLAMPYLQRITSETSQTTSLFIRLGWYAVRIAAVIGHPVLIQRAPIGGTSPLVRGAAGLALLAGLPSGARDEAQRHFAAEEDSGTRREVIANICANIHRDGYLLTASPVHPDASDFAVPLYDAEGQVIAAIAMEGIPESNPVAAELFSSPMGRIMQELAGQTRAAETAMSAGYAHIPAEAITF